MPPTILPITSPATFSTLWPLHFTSFTQPYNPFHKFFNPTYNHTSLDAAIQASKERHVKAWEEDEGCEWVCAVERKDGEGDEKGEEEGMEEGEIVGAACWVVRKGRGGDGEKEGEGKEEEGVNAHWHVEGSEEKAFAEELIGQLRSFVKQRVGAREHIEITQLFVVPTHRRRGVARLLLDHVTSLGDDLGLETIVVVVPYSVPAYEKCGFGCIERIDVDCTVAEPSEKWKAYLREDLRLFLMWRPAGRPWKSGDAVPWKLGTEES